MTVGGGHGRFIGGGGRGLFAGTVGPQTSFKIKDSTTGETMTLTVTAGTILASRTVIIPYADDNDRFVFATTTEILENKTIDSDLNTITNIVNANIKAAAGIEYSKLNLTGSIVDGDIAAAGITTRSKLPSAVAYEDEGNVFTQTQRIKHASGNTTLEMLPSGSGVSTFDLYKTTSLADYERLRMANDVVGFHINIQKTGTGTLRPFRLRMNDNSIITLDIDNTIDLHDRELKNPNTTNIMAASAKSSVVEKLTAADANLPATGNPTRNDVAGTNFPYTVLDYPDASDTDAYWSGFAMPPGIGANKNLTIELTWLSAATTGDVVWGASVLGRATGEAYDSALPANTETTTTTAGTAGLKNVTTITILSAGVDADDSVIVRVSRNGDAAGDTMAADARLVGVVVKWS